MKVIVFVGIARVKRFLRGRTIRAVVRRARCRCGWGASYWTDHVPGGTGGVGGDYEWVRGGGGLVWEERKGGFGVGGCEPFAVHLPTL